MPSSTKPTTINVATREMPSSVARSNKNSFAVAARVARTASPSSAFDALLTRYPVAPGLDRFEDVVAFV